MVDQKNQWVYQIRDDFLENPMPWPIAVTRIAKEDKSILSVERAMAKLINNIIDRKLFINSVCSEGRICGNSLILFSSSLPEDEVFKIEVSTSNSNIIREMIANKAIVISNPCWLGANVLFANKSDLSVIRDYDLFLIGGRQFKSALIDTVSKRTTK